MTQSTGYIAKEHARVSRMPRWLTSEHPFPWVAPLVAMLTVFGIYPLIYALVLSFEQRNRIKRVNEFVGFKNWSQLLNDDRVWNALSVTLTYAGVAIVIHLLCFF